MRIGTMVGDTLRSLFKKPATEVYPFERRPTPERTRGRLTWSPDACSGCNLCVKDCPANALELIVVDRKAKRFVMRWHEDACIYCGQCVQVCRFDAIHLPPDEWELAATGREGFTKTFGNEDDIKQAMDALAERND
ncbi:MAG: 4Fe-4S binding protein [Chloroflexota bacterium]|jgi:formate hydrogenlyase subunit 6/NADH:ubiquinone oxidoreductase subunit I|nr:4Fe-4S binding protein [Chloroflexota bacterium]